MTSPIQQDIDRWIQIYTKHSSPLEKTILNVLSQFQDFTSKFTDFLIEKNSALNEKERFPHDYLANSTEAVLAEYWEPIKRVTQQYQSENFLYGQLQEKYGATRNLLELGYEEVQKLSTNAPQKIKLPTNILVYFDKVEKAIRYPFGPVMLIGVPYQDAERKDWSAVPHEMAHHLFWNLRFNLDGKPRIPIGTNPAIFPDPDNQAAQEENQVLKILNKWSEEIFADTVGALIGKGDFLENSFKKVLARTEVAEDLYYHDNEHPAPYFIPFIRGFALNESVTEAMWEKNGGTRFSNEKNVKYPIQSAEGGEENTRLEEVNAEEIKTKLKRLVNYITGIFESDERMEKTTLTVQTATPLTQEFLGRNETFEFNVAKLYEWIEKEMPIEQTEPVETPDKRMIRALLIPRILEGDKWKCRYCRKTNENDRAGKCRFCGKKR